MSVHLRRPSTTLVAGALVAGALAVLPAPAAQAAPPCTVTWTTPTAVNDPAGWTDTGGAHRLPVASDYVCIVPFELQEEVALTGTFRGLDAPSHTMTADLTLTDPTVTSAVGAFRGQRLSTAGSLTVGTIDTTAARLSGAGTITAVNVTLGCGTTTIDVDLAVAGDLRVGQVPCAPIAVQLGAGTTVSTGLLLAGQGVTFSGPASSSLVLKREVSSFSDAPRLFRLPVVLDGVDLQAYNRPLTFDRAVSLEADDRLVASVQVAPGLVVDGPVALAGTLDVRPVLPGSGLDTVGASYRLVQATSRTGTFGTVTGLALPGGRFLGLTYDATGLVATVKQGPLSGVPAFRVQDVRVAEGAGSATFRVTLDRPAPGANVRVFTESGTASEGGDFTRLEARTLSFAGVDHVDVTVPVLQDTAREPTENFELRLLSNSPGTSIADPVGRAFIVDDEPLAPRLSIGDVTRVAEGGFAMFPIQLVDPSPLGLTRVNVAVVRGTASATDIGAPNQPTFFVGVGSTPQFIVVPVVQDTLKEPNETFGVRVTLQGPPAGNNELMLADDTGWTTIVAGDGGTGMPTPTGPQLRVDDARVDEPGGTAHFTVSRTGPANAPVTVTAATVNGTARAGSDYTATSRTLTWAAGDTSSRDVAVPVRNDAVGELEETFTLALSAPTGGAYVGDPTGLATVRDDDGLPAQIGLADPAASRPGQLATVRLVVTRPVAVTTTVTLATDRGTLSRTTVTIPAGSSTPTGTLPTVTVPLNATVGSTFDVRIVSAPGLLVSDAVGVLTVAP